MELTILIINHSCFKDKKISSFFKTNTHDWCRLIS